MPTPYADLWAVVRDYVAHARGDTVQLSARKIRWIMEKRGVFPRVKRKTRQQTCQARQSRILLEAILARARELGVEPVMTFSGNSHVYRRYALLYVLENPAGIYAGGDPERARLAYEALCGGGIIYRWPRIIVIQR